MPRNPGKRTDLESTVELLRESAGDRQHPANEMSVLY